MYTVGPSNGRALTRGTAHCRAEGSEPSCGADGCSARMGRPFALLEKPGMLKKLFDHHPRSVADALNVFPSRMVVAAMGGSVAEVT